MLGSEKAKEVDNPAENGRSKIEAVHFKIYFKLATCLKNSAFEIQNVFRAKLRLRKAEE